MIPKLSDTPGRIRTTAPRLGEHTETVLKRFGYSDEQIAALRIAKVIGAE